MKTKKILAVMISLFICITLSACKNKSKNSEESKDKNLNIYVDIKDKNSLNIIKYLTEEYKKENPQFKIKVNDVLGGGNNVFEDISKGTEADLIFTSRNTMMELAQKGLIADMAQQYERNKIGDKFHKIVSSYGRVGEKYYGIGIMPYTMEVFYNSEALSKLGIAAPTNIKEMAVVIKKLSSSNIRIPVVLPEDLDINTALSAIVASNTVKLSQLDAAYNNKEAYKNIKDMQRIFDDINTIVKETQLNKNIFELGNDSTINALANGTIPILISTSYYSETLSNGKVNLVENYTITPNKTGNVPIIMNSILCVPTNGKNQEAAGKFIKFVISDDTQEKLTKKGYVTGNKKSDEKLSGLGASISKHLMGAGDDNIVYVYSLPQKYQGVISSKIDAILSGKYSGKEWHEIVDEASK
ncbi:extracellular solute-binding protein [Clostridium swellfunianum]|uniref:ABC transporter substrate-binding protein n=1 Tax=Clostridium swellfunianum TaxID=1367462 RepID=UPI00202EE252|nr:extracellular solute-binding protein [Clostridium swellfunianum]